MIKIIFLMTFLLIGTCSLNAQQEAPGDDQDFLNELNSIKNPFEDGLPKIVVIHKPTLQPSMPKPKPITPSLPAEPVVLPALTLQGVIVGEEIHQAIINDKIVPLHGSIDGAKVNSVTKEGVGLLFKGKKFFIKVE